MPVALCRSVKGCLIPVVDDAVVAVQRCPNPARLEKDLVIWRRPRIAAAGPDVVQSDVQFSMTFSNICGRISAITRRMCLSSKCSRLWLIRIDQ
ncbi:hypothetical protein TNCV_49581 [Trichonephila clavipes]|nr:hypothetical protein TNCV_49581 [Trichonephila clavipes]